MNMTPADAMLYLVIAALFGNSRFDSHFGLCEVWQT